MAYNKKYAELGESVIDYVNDREDAIEQGFADITTPIVTTYTPVSPTTGTVELIRQGDIVHMSGTVTVATSGNRIANIPAELCPKNQIQLQRIGGGNIQISSFRAITGWFSGTMGLDGISWSIGNK